MNIVITGHTQGLGLALYNLFTERGHNVVGYSRSNGHDIKDSIDFDADVFINNAYDPVGQTELLEKYINKWEGTNKLIVNISSKLVFLPKDIESFKVYIQEKKKQNAIIESRYNRNNPRLMNIIPGLIDTDMAKPFEAPKLQTEDLALLICSLVMIKESISVQSIVLDVPGLDWKDIKINV